MAGVRSLEMPGCVVLGVSLPPVGRAKLRIRKANRRSKRHTKGLPGESRVGNAGPFKEGHSKYPPRESRVTQLKISHFETRGNFWPSCGQRGRATSVGVFSCKDCGKFLELTLAARAFSPDGAQKRNRRDIREWKEPYAVNMLQIG